MIQIHIALLVVFVFIFVFTYFGPKKYRILSHWSLATSAALLAINHIVAIASGESWFHLLGVGIWVINVWLHCFLANEKSKGNIPL